MSKMCNHDQYFYFQLFSRSNTSNFCYHSLRQILEVNVIKQHLLYQINKRNPGRRQSVQSFERLSMTLYGKRQTRASLSLCHLFTEFWNKFLRKIGKKSHIHGKHKPTNFRVQHQTADYGRSGFFCSLRENVMLNLSIDR